MTEAGASQAAFACGGYAMRSARPQEFWGQDPRGAAVESFRRARKGPTPRLWSDPVRALITPERAWYVVDAGGLFSCGTSLRTATRYMGRHGH